MMYGFTIGSPIFSKKYQKNGVTFMFGYFNSEEGGQFYVVIILNKILYGQVNMHAYGKKCFEMTC